MRRVLASATVLALVAVFMVSAMGSGSGSSSPSYKVEFDNAFGLVPGADFKVAGVKAGTISKVELPSNCIKGNTTACYALVTVSVTQAGFGSFHKDAFCQSRPQSLIGEYFVDCQPGSSGPVLKSGSMIPVTHTQSTIPLDLLNDVMRMPYRQRFSLIINELGAAVAGRSDDLAAALRRAVPALTQTDNLLNLLANDSQTINQLNVNANTVITALANNSKDVTNFIDEANRAATTSATQSSNISASWRELPGFLEQLKPTLAQLSAATTANLPVVNNLNAASGQLARLFKDLPGFSKASLPAIRALGQASVTGKVAVKAAAPTVVDLNRFAKPTPELAQNLSIVLHDLDNRSRAVEADKRSPGGKGYTGIEALLQYVFNQAMAINTYGPLGHILAVDAFVDPLCSPYATPGTLAQNLAAYGASARRCYAWLGPNQPGVNETDPSNPSACVPDPGGAPPGQAGPSPTACKLPATTPGARDVSTAVASSSAKSSAASASGAKSSGSPSSSSSSGSSGGGSGTSQSSSGSGGFTSVLGHVFEFLGGGATPPPAKSPSGSSSTGSSATNSATSSAPSAGSTQSTGTQAQQLLNYLLAP
jgi:virulence factor Mce-like protein